MAHHQCTAVVPPHVKMGVVMKKAKYFITCHELSASTLQPLRGINELSPEKLRPLLVSPRQRKLAEQEKQLTMDFGE